MRTIINSGGRKDQEIINGVKEATTACYQICNTIAGKINVPLRTNTDIGFTESTYYTLKEQQ